MHYIYTTEGIILKSGGSKEADKFFSLMTKDFGLIKAEAKGVRNLNSKLRYSLQDFSLAKISLVRGKEKWRITNAKFERNFLSDLRGHNEAKSIIARISLLICRLIHGEEKNELLFEYFKNGVVFLADKKPDGDILKNAEYLIVLRILYSLGYLGTTPDWGIFTDTLLFETDLLMRMDQSKQKAIETINRSLKATNL